MVHRPNRKSFILFISVYPCLISSANSTDTPAARVRDTGTASKLLHRHPLKPHVSQGRTLVKAEVLDILHRKDRHARSGLRLDVLKVRALHIVEPERRTPLLLHVADLDVVH